MNKSYGKDAERAKYRRYWVIGIIIAILVAALLIWNSGIFTKRAEAATVGEHSYTVAEVQYYYQTVASNTIQMAQQYKDYGIESGYDPNKAPSEQMYDEEEGKTYADYFMESALTQLQRTSILCDQAEAAGYTLSAEGQKIVDDNMHYLELYSLQSGYSESAYVKMLYGRYATKGLFEDMLTDAVLADEYAQEKSKEFTYDEDKLDAYYNENADSLDSYAYNICYMNAQTEPKTDEAGNPVEPTEEETKAAMDAAKEKGDQMVAEVQSGAEFNTAVANYVDEQTAESFRDPAHEHPSDVLGSELDSTFSAWMMDKSRQPGDITSIEAPGTGYCVVQFLSREKSEDSYATATYHSILVTAETTEGENGAAPTADQLTAAQVQANALLDEWKSGEATAASFEALAKEKSTDELTKDKGGIHEDANRNALPAPVSQWVFDNERKSGDTAVVESIGSNGMPAGYEVLYMDNFGTVRWKYQAETALRGQDYEAWYKDIEAKYPAALTEKAAVIPTL